MDEENPVLFLDLDGVLHPQPCSEAMLFSRAPLLENALRDFGRWEIVISSSWRLQLTIAEIKERLPADLAARVVGVTPSCAHESLLGHAPTLGQHTQGIREIEILAWLKQNRIGGAWRTPFVALDDWPYNFSHPTPPWVVLCDPNVGLDHISAGRLVNWMAGQ